MDKYAIYARFSREGQNEKSAEDQIYECTEYIKKKGGMITATYEDERINADNIPAPNKKSDRWSDSAVRQILRNETYIGRRFFNRNSYIKNPATGKYVEHRNPESEWLVNEDEALRIMGENLWNSVQARWKEINSKACYICIKNALTGKRRKNYMLSGLIFCSECGGTYTLGSKNRYNCENYKRDNCKNGNSIRRQIVENHVLDLLLNKMLTPERIDKFLKSYQRSLEEAKGKLDNDNAGTRRKLKKIDKEIDAFMDVIAQGIVTKSTRTRLLELEERKQEFEKELKPIPELFILDDKLVDQYRGLLEDMSGALDDDSVRYKAMNIIRPLIAKIILYPVDQGLRAEIHGQIENLLYMHIDKDGNFFYIPESDIEQLTT